MAFADLRLQEIRLGKKLQKKTVIITGEIGAGKTATIKKLVEQFKNEGLTVGGFYQQRILENNETIGYDYIETDSGKQIEFLRKKKIRHTESWASAFSELINQNQSIVIASFRKDLLSELQSKFGIFGAPVFDLGHQPISKIAIGINTFVHKNIALANDFKK